MDQRRDAPLTRAAFGVLGEPGPTPIEREWQALAQTDQDTIFFWTGVWNRRGTQEGWTWANWHISDRPDHGGRPHPAVATPAAHVERILSPLAHEARIRLLQAMYDGPKTSGELSEATGLKGGNLYYHLKELLYAAYVKELDGGYDLTTLGCKVLLTVAVIASRAVKDRAEQGLEVSSP